MNDTPSKFISVYEAAGRIALECGELAKLAAGVRESSKYLEAAGEPVAFAFRDGAHYVCNTELVDDFIDDFKRRS